MKFFRAALIAIAVVAHLRAQIVEAYVPDSDPTTGVAANSIPFNPNFGPTPGAYTQMLIVPATQLAAQGVPAGAQLLDVALAACGTGVLILPSFKVSVGHVGTPYPAPALAPAFVTQFSLYDSDLSGTFFWNVVGDTWNALGVGGGGFVWDGVNDVGVFTTHQGLTVGSNTGWPGTFWRGGSTPRLYAPGYEATTAAVMSSTALKIKLVFASGPNAYAAATPYGTPTAGQNGVPTIVPLGLPAFSNPAFGVALGNAFPGALAALAWSGGSANSPIGSGPDDVRLLIDVGPTSNLGFAWTYADGTGAAGAVFAIPAYDPALVGAHVYAQWFVVGDPSAPPTIFGAPLAASAGLDVRIGL
jgi:hypothetical protein